MIWYEKWLRNFMIIIHQLLIVVYTHIKFTYTVTRFTSTLIKSVRCYKNDYHEKIIMYHHQHNYYMYTMYKYITKDVIYISSDTMY